MAQRTSLLLLLVVGCTAIHAVPVSSKTPSQTEALEYLSQYGYIQGNTTDIRAGLTSADAVNSTIKEFQKFVSLTPTGELDEATVQKMIRPYCGVHDFMPSGNYTRNRRYSISGTRWTKRHLTYTLLHYPSYMKFSTVINEIVRAFKVWSDQVDLTFTLVRDKTSADIVLDFASWTHGDNAPFDGPGYTVAHAYAPPRGEVHFDSSEYWTVNSYKGTNLFQVAAHEIGHALGLAHSEYEEALMYYKFLGYNPDFRLHEDDIAGIQSLYGPKTPSN